MARSEGIEPSSKVLEALVLPLHQLRIWYGRKELNFLPTLYKNAALTDELLPYGGPKQNRTVTSALQVQCAPVITISPYGPAGRN